MWRASKRPLGPAKLTTLLPLAALLLLSVATAPASARALSAMIGLPTETKDVQGQQVPLPSDAVRRAATRLPTDAHGEQLPLPSDAEKRAAQGQPPAGPFGEPPPPPPPPADRQAERDRKLQAILAGLKPEDVIQVLTGRGPCTQPMWQCRARPCALTTSDAAGGQVPVCPEPFYCLDDYCGGCNHICASEDQLRQAVGKLIPGMGGRPQP